MGKVKILVRSMKHDMRKVKQVGKPSLKSKNKISQKLKVKNHCKSKEVKHKKPIEKISTHESAELSSSESEDLEVKKTIENGHPVASGSESDTTLPYYLRQISVSEDSMDHDFQAQQKRKKKNRVNYKEKNICVEESEMSKNSIFVVPSRSMVVIILAEPTSLSIQGMVNVQAISGSITILGKKLTQMAPPLTLFSSTKYCYLKIETLHSEQIWKSLSRSEDLRCKLEAIVSKDTTAEILSKCENNSVIITIEKHLPSLALNFIRYYVRSVFHMDKMGLQHNAALLKYGFALSQNDDTSINMDARYEVLASSVLHSIRMSRIKHLPGARILIYGAKNCGKTTLLRFLTNKIIDEFGKCCYLDADPGQTEFTVPGCVSLTEVTKPLLGHSFTHLKEPLKSIFIGTITPASSPEMYLKSLSKLNEFYNKHYSTETLVVNTMGWIQGIGAMCLDSLITAVEPTMLIELVVEGRNSMFEYSGPIPSRDMVRDRLIVPRSQLLRMGLNAPELRNLTILAYFGKCQKAVYDCLKPFNSIQPYSIRWKDIALYLFDTHVPPEKMFYAMNSSIVALCRVEEKLLLESKIPMFPKTVEDEPDNECLGFGIVRAIDVTKKLFYIVTPIPYETLKKVNVLMKGNIMIPKELHMKQEIEGIRLPFIKQVFDTACDVRKSVKKRRSYI